MANKDYHCIWTDLGGEFQNELWQELCRLLGVTRLRTTAYCPSTNGKIERWHRALHSMMAKVVDTKHKRLVEFLPFVTAAYNSTTHDSTTFSRNFLMFGRADVDSGHCSWLSLSGCMFGH